MQPPFSNKVFLNIKIHLWGEWYRCHTLEAPNYATYPYKKERKKLSQNNNNNNNSIQTISVE